MIYVGGGGTLHKCKKVTYRGNVGQVGDAVDAANISAKRSNTCSTQ